MALIYETRNYIVESHEKPFVSRTDGGHIRIIPKVLVADRTELSPRKAIELMRLTMAVGRAMEVAMNNLGIPVVKINYEDLGNWAFKNNKKPFLHIHIFGRSKNAKYQVFPEAVQLPDRSSGFYDNFEGLNNDDVLAIRKEIESLFKEEKYLDENWRL